MSKIQNNENFLIQGSALAVAAILARMIGLIYRVPLTAILGDVGNNYYGCAFDIYNILLLLSSYSLPMAVSRLVSDYRTKQKEGNVQRVLRCAFGFAGTVGVLSCAFVFFCADWMTDMLFRTPKSRLALQVLSPTLLLTALLGVFRGYYQGIQHMRPSAVSQVFEQLVNAVVSVAAAYFLSGYGVRQAQKHSGDESVRAAYGAAGASLGTVAGALASLALLLIIYIRHSRKQHRGSCAEQTFRAGYLGLLSAMLRTVLPILAASALYNINIVLEQMLFKHILSQTVAESVVSRWWGVYSGKFKTLVNFPVAVAAAIGAACIPSITASSAKEDKKGVVQKTNLAIRFVMLLALPSAFFLMLLGGPLMQLLFGDTSVLAANLLLAGGMAVIFYSLSTVTASILQGVGRLRAPVINSGLALGMDLLVLYCCLKFTALTIYSVVVGMLCFGICVTVLNQLSLYRSGVWKPEWVHTFLLPLLCAALMAATARLAYFALSRLIPTVYVTLPVSIAAGLFAYLTLLLLFGALTAEELSMLPGGRRLGLLAKRLQS